MCYSLVYNHLSKLNWLVTNLLIAYWHVPLLWVCPNFIFYRWKLSLYWGTVHLISRVRVWNVFFSELVIFFCSATIILFFSHFVHVLIGQIVKKKILSLAIKNNYFFHWKLKSLDFFSKKKQANTPNPLLMSNGPP